MNIVRTTISLPTDLHTEFQDLIGKDKSFSQYIKIAITEYIKQKKHAQVVQEMEASYKRHAGIFKKSAEEHHEFRTELTDTISTSL